MRYSKLFVLLFALGMGNLCFAGGDEHDREAAEEAEHEEGSLELTAEQRAALGIETAAVSLRSLPVEVTAPGEVEVNLYRSAQITPRIAAQVVARHVQMGQVIKKGEPVVTLSSVAMAEAQGELLIADREWRRVQKLGRKVVSETRYVEAQVKRQQSYAKVLAYGMTPEQTEHLLTQGDVSRATGEFALLAPQDGLVHDDDFTLGELIEPGRVLVRLTDESSLWVEAKLDPRSAATVQLGNPARISVAAGRSFEGRVIQFHHHMDEASRTLVVRLEVQNTDEGLHPGQFVTVAIDSGESRPVLAVPREAVLLLQGGPAVFRLEGERFEPQAVQTGATGGAWTEITAGLTEGEQIAVKGAFVLKSLALKSQIGDHD
jgi:cobalt-zinc-cadmium efflux system membrane fusion protein